MGQLRIFPVIICGGVGSRLWPLSRKSYPKQFLNILGNSSKTMLQQTQERINDFEGLEKPIIICNNEHRFLVAEQMRNIGIDPFAIILEPIGKNTAPAITLASLKIKETVEDAIMFILSADHKIEDNKTFFNVYKKALPFAKKGNLITFGIVPNYPETGYGYIKSKEELNKNDVIAKDIEQFIEKPKKSIANELYKNKKYSWNSGIFVFKLSTYLEELNKFSPKVLECCTNAMKKTTQDLDFIRVDKNFFEKSPNIAVDVAVMENTKLGKVLLLDAGWDDVGSWESLWKNEKKDSNGNVVIGKVFNEKSENCYIRSVDKLMVAIGLKDVIVVNSGDAILISKKEFSKEIKNIVNKLGEEGYEEATQNKKVFRPWGNYESLINEKYWQVKKIEVNPFQELSLQLHNYRSEHWIVVKGTAKVQINEKIIYLKHNQSTYVPRKSKHRLTNPSKNPLILIEIQSGDYLGEDDITRFEDKYGRIKK